MDVTVGDPSPKKRRRRSVREFWCNFQTNLMQPKLDYAESPKSSWGNFKNFSLAFDGIPHERVELKRYTVCTFKKACRKADMWKLSLRRL